MLFRVCKILIFLVSGDLHILVPRGRAPFGQHQESRALASTSGQVQHRKSAIHGLPVTLRMLRVKSDKSDCVYNSIQNGNVVGPDQKEHGLWRRECLVRGPI